MTGLALTLLLLQAQASSSRTYSIAGTAVDSITKRPLPKTRIVLSSVTPRPSSIFALTGPDGRFHFDGLTPGKYNMAGERLGYPRQSFGIRTLYARYISAVIVGENQKTDSLVFPMIRGGVIIGKVTEANGEPIAGMTVNALHVVGIGHGRRVARYFTQTTDDRGQYRIPYLPQGRFAVVVMGRPWQQEARVSTHHMTYPSTYFPGTTSPDEAALVDVKHGQESRADVIIVQVPAARLVGQVPGNAADKRYIYLMTPSLFGFKVTLGSSHWVGANGVTVEDLPPGHYVINLVYEGTKRGAYQPVDVAAPETKVTIGETPPAQVSAGIVVEGNARPSASTASVTLVSLDAESSRSQPISANGRALFDGLPPGRYTPTVTFGRDQGAVVAVKARGAAVSGTVITIPETGNVDLDITIDGSAIDLTGKIVCDAAPCSGILAMLVKRSGWEVTGAYRFDQSDSDGTFSWKGVAAGEYMMFAFENTDPLDYDDPAVIRQLLPGAQNVTVTGDPKQTVTLQLTGSSGGK